MKNRFASPYARKGMMRRPAKPRELSYSELENMVRHYEAESRRTDRAPYHAEAARRLHVTYSQQLNERRKAQARKIRDAARQDHA